jgi:FkbM family methyltransferase
MSRVGWLIDRFFIKQPLLRRAVTRLLEGDCEKQVEVTGTKLTVHTIKEHGYLRASRLCRNSSLLRDELSVIINLSLLLNESDTFIDVGANVGFYTHTAARFAKLLPGMRVYAYEANPDTYARLVREAPRHVRARQIAISDRAGSLDFVEGAVSHVFTVSGKASRYSIEERVVCVPAHRLDECDIKGDSLVIKVDVEGQEMEVLKGAAGLLEAGRVKAVYLDGYENRGVEEMLKEYGFRLFDGRTLDAVSGDVFSLLAVHPAKQAGLFTHPG